MFNFNVDTNRVRFAHDLESLGITLDELTDKGIKKTLPVALDEFNVITAQYGKAAQKSEKGAIKAWGDMVSEYLDALAMAQTESNKRATRKESAAAEAEADAENLPSAQAAKDLAICEKALALEASTMLVKFRKDNVEYAWHMLVTHVRDYIHLGRLAGRNSVETLAEIRSHVYDLAGYQARNKEAKAAAKDGDMDADIKAQMEVNTTFENNVTRAVKCGLLAERGDINIHLGEVDGVTRLIAPFNEVQPMVLAGGTEKPNPFKHDVPVTITNLESLYAKIFQGATRATQAGKVQGIKDAAKSLASNAGGYKDFSPEVKGDIDTALQTFMTQPEAVKAGMTSEPVLVIKTFGEVLENMDHTEQTILALIGLADAIEVITEGFEGGEDKATQATA